MKNPTTYKTYIKDAVRTECDYTPVIGRVVNPKTLALIHGAMGLATESGEFLDSVKKHIFYGAPLDIVNLKEEMGDLLWYLAILANMMGEANFTNILQANIEKLRARYPEKFTEEKAGNRNFPVEREILSKWDASHETSCE